MPNESYHVRVAKDYLVFSAAHFITYNGDVCERLHGHNYRVATEVHGPLDDNYYVVDFILLRDVLKQIVDQLDHRVLLPTQHSLIQVVESESEVEATFQDRRWIFPRDDCILLPVANTTAEQLAQYISNNLIRFLSEKAEIRLNRLVVEVDENNGQLGVHEVRFEAK